MYIYETYLFYVYEYLCTMYVYVPRACLVPAKIRSGCEWAWNYSYQDTVAIF